MPLLIFLSAKNMLNIENFIFLFSIYAIFEQEYMLHSYYISVPISTILQTFPLVKHSTIEANFSFRPLAVVVRFLLLSFRKFVRFFSHSENAFFDYAKTFRRRFAKFNSISQKSSCVLWPVHSFFICIFFTTDFIRISDVFELRSLLYFSIYFGLFVCN